VFWVFDALSIGQSQPESQSRLRLLLRLRKERVSIKDISEMADFGITQIWGFYSLAGGLKNIH